MKRLIILFIAALLSAGTYAADTANDNPPLTKKEQRRTLRGYKGFVEVGVGFSHHNYNYIGSPYVDKTQIGFFADASTIHGYQFSKVFFLGGGVGITECTETNVMVPIFADLRFNLLDKRISPVIDVRGGYAVGDHNGGYVSLNIGARFGLKKRQESAVYTMAGFSWIGDTGRGFLGVWDEKDRTCLGIFLRVGYEF